ncbi:hypothetical protein ACK3SF_00400 [Candidatus Nanosalina sp. VS9-1]|uniref:hypothetical protein n=1 Tax=Candidatus Nanosalina sp. VS9-1 TaxID=3388566 RepID=UPI0039E1EC6B
MDNKHIILGLIAFTVIVSGCSSVTDALPSGNSNTDSQPEQIPGKGLEVTGFSISDQTLSPGQTAEVTLTMQNYHREEIELGEVTLYDLGPLLTKEKQGCTPDEEDLEAATDNVNPIIECSWELTAPSENMVGGFSQRSASFTANIPYETSIQNYRPLKVEFRPLQDINSTSQKSISFTNGEVDVQASVETPVAFGEQKTISFNLKRAGDGRVDEEYSFDYQPVAVFDLNGDDEVTGEGAECPESDEVILGGGLDFSCSISMEGTSSEVRNVFFTASYKYVKSPTLGITIVNE